MPITYDSVSNSGYEAALSTYNWSHTVGSLSYGGLIVAVAVLATGSVTSVTYNGINLSFIRADTNGVIRSELWWMFNPTTGANSVVVTLNTTLTSIAGATSFNFFGGLRNSAGNNGTNTPATVNLTTVDDNSFVFGALATVTAAGATDAGGQTNRWTSSGALGTNIGSTKGLVTPAAATTLTWNGIGVVDSWAASAVELRGITPNPAKIKVV